MEYLTSSLEKNNVTVNLKTQRSFHSLAIDSAWAAGWISYNWTKEPRFRIEREYNNTHVKLCLKYSLKPSMISCILTMRHAWIGTESFYKYMYIASGKVLRFYYWVLMKTRFVVHDHAEPPEHSPSDNSTRPIGQRSFGWNGFQVFSRLLLFFSLCVCVSHPLYPRTVGETAVDCVCHTPVTVAMVKEQVTPTTGPNYHPSFSIAYCRLLYC